jgi:hypothetical protein
MRRMKPFLPAAVALCLLLAGCNALLQKGIPENADQFAREFIEMVAAGDYAAAQQMLDPSIQGPDALRKLQGFHAVLAQGGKIEFETIGYYLVKDSHNAPGVYQDNLSYQLRIGERWAAGSVALNVTEGGMAVFGCHFALIPDSLAVLNRFSLRGKTPFQYGFLLLCAAVPAFIIYTLVLCMRTRLRRKWVWVVFILFGLVQFQMNWTTGEWGIQPLSLLLLGASAFRANMYAPWIITFALPIGAMLFLARRKRMAIRE